MTGVYLVGQVVTAILIFNIYGGLDMIWVKPLSTLFGLIKIFEFDVDIFSLSCLVGSDWKLGRCLTKVLALPLGVVVLCLGLAVLHAVPAMHPHTALNKEALCNSVGLLWSIFFIAVCNISLDGFTCSLNPNDKFTLTSDRSVLCWEDGAHMAYIVVSVIAILAYPISFLAFSGLIVYNYNRWAIERGSAFANRVRFLVTRMQPHLYVFAFWYNVRNFALALVPAILSRNFSIQVLGLLVLSMAWLVAQVRYFPWRFRILNNFDAFVSCGQILLLTCFAMLGGLDSRLSQEQLGWIIVIIMLTYLI